MLLVGYHDDKAGNNVAQFSDACVRESEKVLTGIDLKDAELRGLSFAPDGALWVLDGGAKASRILRFLRRGKSYEYTNAVASWPTVSSLWHPFDFAFAGQAGQLCCYVSNQDTDVVARLVVSRDFTQATPAPPAPALPVDGTFLDGTFVAASARKLPEVEETTRVSQLDGGLNVLVELLEHEDKQTHERELQEKVTHSVRGVLWNGTTLYVADEPGNAIKLYNAEGAFQGQTEPFSAPVHLCVRRETYKGAIVETLYASGERGVFCATLPLPQKWPRIFTFSSKPLIEMEGASGVAFGPTTMYVGERKSGQIYSFESFSREAKDHPHKALSAYGSPEFILYVPNTQAPFGSS